MFRASPIDNNGRMCSVSICIKSIVSKCIILHLCLHGINLQVHIDFLLFHFSGNSRNGLVVRMEVLLETITV